MGFLIHDIRYAFRLFAKHPGVTAVAVLSLALATGPNAALFGVIRTLFVHNTQVPNENELISIQAFGLSYPDYADIASRVTATDGLATWARKIMPVTVEGFQETTTTNLVTPNYFTVLALKPERGRLFSVELDSESLSEQPAVISYSLWQRRFASSPNVIGQPLQLSDRTLTIVGVAPKGFRGMDFQVPIDLWIPFSPMQSGINGLLGHLDRRDRPHFEQALGRLRPGGTLEQARAELDAIGRNLAETYPSTNRNRTFHGYMFAKDQARKSVIVGGIGLGLVGLVLLVACANVASLMLAQGETRRREIAVRLSLGAGRLRLVRQLLTESCLLALMGGAAGVLLGYWLLQIPVKPPMGFSMDFGVQLDWGVVVYAIALSLLTALLFGLVPALQSTKADLVTNLKSESGDGRRRWKYFTPRAALIVTQIAIAQFLVAGTVLCLRSYLNLEASNPGFDRNRNVLFSMLAPTAAGRQTPLTPAGMLALNDQLRTLPGVVQVSNLAAIPLSGSGGGMKQKVLLPGDSEETDVRFNTVGSGYFSVMGTRLLAGREFSTTEAGNASRVAVVNRALAKRIAPDGQAIGRWIRVEGVDREVIGIAEDGSYGHLREQAPPFLFLPGLSVNLAIQTAGDPAAIADAIRTTIARETPQLIVINFVTMEQNMNFATYIDRMLVTLLGSLSLLGIGLAAVGLYGVVAYSVNRRTREIGIRMALGAQPGSVLKMFLGEGLRLSLAGISIGLAASIAGAILASKILFGVAPLDPLSYLAAAVFVVAITLTATRIPAGRAAGVDPASAVRSE